MKIKQKKLASFILSGAAIYILGAKIIFAENTELNVIDEDGQSSVSPSKKYTLLSHLYKYDKESDSVELGTRFLYFTILDADGNTIFESDKTRFTARHRTYFTWGDIDDTVWVYSSDIGTKYYSYDDDAQTWIENSYIKWVRDESGEREKITTRALPKSLEQVLN